MTVSVDTEKGMADYQKEEKNILPGSYGCDILLQDTSLNKVKDPSFPNDAYLVWYDIDGVERLDLVRGSRVRIFDMYYDKHGPGVVKRIDFGYGRTNPKLWGYKQPENKKKR